MALFFITSVRLSSERALANVCHMLAASFITSEFAWLLDAFDFFPSKSEASTDSRPCSDMGNSVIDEGEVGCC